LSSSAADSQAAGLQRVAPQRRTILLVDPNPGRRCSPPCPIWPGGCAGALVQRPFGEILPANVEHLQAAASLIDLEAGTVLAGTKPSPTNSC
jgi:hypothetical protein